MDSPTHSWFSALGVNNPNFMEQFDFFNTNMEEEFVAKFTKEYFPDILSPTGNSSTSTTTTFCTATPFLQPPPKPPVPQSSFPNNGAASSAPLILNFSNAINNPPKKVKTARPLSPPPPDSDWTNNINGSNTSEIVQTVKKTRRVRPPYDHITAERKRREQLSQRFVALSGMVPGLKKMDKTTVLGDTIKYLKHLQEKVKTLEEQGKKQTMESVVLVRKSRVVMEEDGGRPEAEQPLPEIEVRLCNNQILLKIHCEKQKGVLAELLRKVEKLNLCVLNTNVSPFGSMALYIIIVAEMEKEFNSTAKDIAKDIRSTLLRR